MRCMVTIMYGMSRVNNLIHTGLVRLPAIYIYDLPY